MFSFDLPEVDPLFGSSETGIGAALCSQAQKIDFLDCVTDLETLGLRDTYESDFSCGQNSRADGLRFPAIPLLVAAILLVAAWAPARRPYNYNPAFQDRRDIGTYKSRYATRFQRHGRLQIAAPPFPITGMGACKSPSAIPHYSGANEHFSSIRII